VKIDYQKLIPELKEWDLNYQHAESTNVLARWCRRKQVWVEPIDSWTAANARFDHFVMYARMIWPEFVEHDDCVFLADEFTGESYRTWRRQLDKTRTEAMLNHRHITDLFLNSEFKPNLEIVLYIGRYLKEVWTEKLKRDFSKRKFVVSFPEEPPTPEDLVSYEVTFFQDR
jgi:hypothetical protein